MFVLKLIGGGDSKLISAFALWLASFDGLMAFLFYMGLCGALLGFVALFLKKRKPIRTENKKSWFYRVQSGESVVPYGVPIAIGAFAGFFASNMISGETFSLFLM